MPWFITSLTKNLENKRTFGFYNDFNSAYSTITNNVGNLEEQLYSYLVLEYIEAGIHPLVQIEHWWQWNEALKRWDKIGNKPNKCKFTNIALG